MESLKSESRRSLPTEMDCKSSTEEPVSDEEVQLERFDSVESFRTRTSTESRTVSMVSTESYETASSSFPSWDRNSCQGNRRSCLLGWINSLEETTRRTLFIHHLPIEICDPVKDISLFSYEAEFCRICHCGGEDEELIAPCRCSGSAKFAHQSCLLSWFELKKDKTCELCLYEISVKKMGFKPILQWRLPWRSCDIVAYLFLFYCLVLVVFIVMVLWIASKRCLSPICVVLYFACGLAVCYFTYCCGCIEHIRYYWKAWIDVNRQWLIITHKDDVQVHNNVIEKKISNESCKAREEFV
ncbi:uncharacterized protein LOC111320864 isoform X1 [Stylophora pistillata]|uniref:uncharacterized protein LOC111320864 isoform X1 n=1 Tax=Stylophora pistillata TaxID=50429 RepID=UPI000C03DC3D|nr:uncharacterized protein LOC111320864 isoform X1 [Stylophora pistillata]